MSVMHVPPEGREPPRLPVADNPMVGAAWLADTQLGPTPATLWDGYRVGALLMDEQTERIGVSHAFDGKWYTLKNTCGTPAVWQAHKDHVRVATGAERRTLGLSPRSVD
ncbi:hypothetical protein [Streptomyces sp. URMC 123]|uniref:hypothetical protein n=1 Tax=Streptomyces sp. URMC 123 TaxID=3423403 RepID=UPI003F1D25E7